jgi:dTDP-4-dehydrorhamnose 3,5-epimerase
VFDVAVDIRRSSPTFGQWVGAELTRTTTASSGCRPASPTASWCSASTADFLYKTTDYYAPQHERCIAWDDPAIGIDWLEVGMQPVLSAKDVQGLRLLDAEVFP